MRVCSKFGVNICECLCRKQHNHHLSVKVVFTDRAVIAATVFPRSVFYNMYIYIYRLHVYTYMYLKLAALVLHIRQRNNNSSNSSCTITIML